LILSIAEANDIQYDIQYKVVVNHEEQYSPWPAERSSPAGWTDAGKSGTRQECLAYIDEVWTDMRPLSLRERWLRPNPTAMRETAGPPPTTRRDRIARARTSPRSQGVRSKSLRTAAQSGNLLRHDSRWLCLPKSPFERT
jgi:MbtH protein